MGKPRLSAYVRFAVAVGMLGYVMLLEAQSLPGVRNPNGVRLVVAEEDSEPALHVVLPDNSKESAIKILFPEHVTARRQGSSEGERLYLFRLGLNGKRPMWRQAGQVIEYESDLKESIHLLARATLEDDGVLFHYEFQNRSDVNYEMITASHRPADDRRSCMMSAWSARMCIARMDSSCLPWRRRRV